jgi:long-chain fatty acid transport protein
VNQVCRLLCLVPCLVAGALMGAAQASVYDLYGFTPRGRAMGNAQTADADDFSGVFYNPGALTRRKQIVVGAGLVHTRPNLTIDREYRLETQREVPSVLPDAFTGINIGALFPLGRKFGDRVAIAASMYLPLLRLLSASSVDAQVPQFYRYEQQPDKFVFLASAAFEVTDWLSVGAGVQVLASLDGQIDLGVELANRRVARRALVVDIAPTASAVLGMLVTPTKGLRFGLSWRDDIQLDYALPGEITIDNLVRLDLALSGTVLFTPQTLSGGVAWEPALGWTLAADVSWLRWSKAPDPSPTVAIDLSGEILEGLGLGDRIDIQNGAPVDLGFRDIIEVRLGAEYLPHAQIATRLGYIYRPTPAPVPTGAFNQIDPNAHVLSAGFGFTFRDPLEVRENPVTIDFVYQATLMQSQAVQQRAGDADRVGNYIAGGAVHSFGLAFRHDL